MFVKSFQILTEVLEKTEYDIQSSERCVMRNPVNTTDKKKGTQEFVFMSEYIRPSSTKGWTGPVPTEGQDLLLYCYMLIWESKILPSDVSAFHPMLIFGNEMLKNEQRLHQWAELWVINTMPVKFIYNEQLPDGKQIWLSWTLTRRIICQVCFPLELRIFFIIRVL